jgi:hypothetical protein
LPNCFFGFNCQEKIQRMASLIKTINFVLTYFWATSKIQIFIVFATLPIYLFDYDDFYKIVFSVNSFIINLIIAYSLSKTDEYLRSNGFYKFLNISNISISISKLIILFSFLSIHLSLLLLHTLKVSFKVCLVFNIVMLLAFINNIVFIEIKGKVISFSILILFLSIFFLTCNIAQILLFIILLLVISVLFLYRVYHYYIANIV